MCIVVDCTSNESTCNKINHRWLAPLFGRDSLGWLCERGVIKPSVITCCNSCDWEAGNTRILSIAPSENQIISSGNSHLNLNHEALCAAVRWRGYMMFVDILCWVYNLSQVNITAHLRLQQVGCKWIETLPRWVDFPSDDLRHVFSWSRFVPVGFYAFHVQLLAGWLVTLPFDRWTWTITVGEPVWTLIVFLTTS